MPGTASNVRVFTNADVYVAPKDTAGPANCAAAWPGSWNAVGLLNGEDGFTEKREDDKSEFYSWGGNLLRKTKSKHRRTLTFTCLEDNATVFALVNPGGTRNTSSGLTTDVHKAGSDNTVIALGLEVKDGNFVRRRIVKRATIEEIGEIKDAEGDITAYEITVAVLDDGTGTLWTDLSGTPTS